MWLVYIWSKADGSLIYDSEPLNPNTAVFKLGPRTKGGPRRVPTGSARGFRKVVIVCSF